MPPKQLLENAAPTPFGWVFTATEFDLTSMVSFRNQLLNLSRVCGAQGSVAPAVEQGSVPASSFELTK
jgi:hypothetical protein